MSIDHVSTYKSVILRKKSKGKGKKAAAHKDVANGAAAPVAQATTKPAAVSLSEQVAMLKAASAALGKEEAKKIIDLL